MMSLSKKGICYTQGDTRNRNIIVLKHVCYILILVRKKSRSGLPSPLLYSTYKGNRIPHKITR